MKKRHKKRARPGTRGKGRYYRVVVRPKSGFATFRVQDVGASGGAQRLAGRRANGSWDTQAWLIPKSQAHVSSGVLVGNTAKIKGILRKLGSKPRRVKADVFRAKPRKKVGRGRGRRRKKRR